MCGIAGILAPPGAEPPSLRDLEAMVAVLGHRGPDGNGFYRDQRVGLGHARLSIIDLAGGAQPMSNENGSLWITFNGEIFNYRELRVELEAAGHVFRTSSDTEAIIHGYEEWGHKAWARFNGQFAVGLWDCKRRELVLARDQFGIVPLFYAQTPRGVVFASEVKSLFVSGRLKPEFDAAGLMHTFTRWSAPAPGSVFAGVLCVPPGHVVTFDAELGRRVEAWWQPDFSPAASPRYASEDEAVDALEELLRNAVSFRLRADVPVGAYVSGGLDSSLVTALIQGAQLSDLETFSIRFEDEAFDETPQQRLMVERLGTRHHEVLVGGRDIAQNLPEVVRHCETPLLRTAPVPLFLLSDLVRRNGTKVVLTGEGADELFAGYSIFKEDKIRRFWARNPQSKFRSALLSRVHHYVGGDQHEGRMWREFFRRGLTDTDNPFYSHAVRWANTAWTTRFLSKDLVGRIDGAALDEDLARALPAGYRTWPALGRAQALEIMTFMSPYLLSCQGDRVSLGHGVEARYAFLDPAVIEFATKLPSHMKLNVLKDKYILRKLGARHLPLDISARPKQPYRAPMTTAFFGPGAPEYVREMLSVQQLEVQGLADVGPARMLAEKAWSRDGKLPSEREEMALIGILTLQLLAQWLRVDLPREVPARVAALRSRRPAVLEERAA